MHEKELVFKNRTLVTKRRKIPRQALWINVVSKHIPIDYVNMVSSSEHALKRAATLRVLGKYLNGPTVLSPLLAVIFPFTINVADVILLKQVVFVTVQAFSLRRINITKVGFVQSGCNLESKYCFLEKGWKP